MTIGYVDRKAPIDAEVVLQYWNHSAVHESWFTTTWEASAKALSLHFDLNPFSFDVPVQHCLGLPVPKRRANLGLNVQFAELTEVAIESPSQNLWQRFETPHEDVRLLLDKAGADPGLTGCISRHGPLTHRLDATENPNLPDPPSSSDESQGQGRPHRVPLRHLPAWVETLWNVLQDEGATELLEEGPVIYLSTCYLSHRHCVRQADSRPIRLNRRYAEWVEEFKLVWGDMFDRQAGYELFLVDPEPPISLTRGISGIVLIVQHAEPDRVAVLTTALFDELPSPRTLEIAHVMDIWADYPTVLHRAEAFEACREAERQDLRPCVIRAGRHVFPRERQLRLHDGLGLVVNVPMLLDEEAWDTYVRPYMEQWDDNGGNAQRRHPEDEDDQVAMMARRPRPHPSLSPSTSTSGQTPSQRSSSREPSSGTGTWQRTVVFTLDGTAASCLLPVDSEDEKLRRIATALNTFQEDIAGVITVEDRPEDLVTVQLQCLLIQRGFERRPSGFLRLVLLDLEIIEQNEILPGAFRRMAKWVPHVTTTTSLFRILSLEDLLHRHEEETHLWINNVPIDMKQIEPHTIVDGDYLKIYIGSEEQRFRCEVDGEEMMFLQLYDKHQAKIGDQHVSEPSTLDICGARARRRIRPPRPGPLHEEDDPDERRLRTLWNRPLLQTRGLENEPVMMFDTWFLSALDFPRCSTGRLVTLHEDVRQWEQALRQVWRDRQHPHWPIRIVMITPTPIGAAHGGHLLILQHEHPAEAGVLISVSGHVDTDRFAQLVPGELQYERLLWFADQEDRCPRAQWTCSAQHNRQPILPTTRWRAINGQHIELQVKRRAAAQPLPVPSQTSSMSCSLDDFVFNPDAPQFVPGVPTIEAMPEVIQDLHEEWLRTAFSWEGEEATADVTTWFVDQSDPPQRVCWQARNVQLTSQFARWEHDIKQRWVDRITAGAPLELVLVQPRPFPHGRPVAAHILLIQRPQHELVTSLITVYDGTVPADGPVARLALTTSEHIFLEHFIHSLGLTQRCLLAGADRLCNAWYGQYRLVLGRPLQGRDGYGILMHLSARPLVNVHDHVAFLQVSTSVSRTPILSENIAATERPDRVTICLEDHLSGNVAVTLIDGIGHCQLPDHVEVTHPVTSEKVQEELTHWGHQCQVLDCEYGNYFLCLDSTGTIDEYLSHYIFIHDDPSDKNGVTLHSEPTPAPETKNLEFLCQLDYPRAVVLQAKQIHLRWHCVVFHHREPQQAEVPRKVRDKTPWPPQYDHVRTNAKLIETEQISVENTQCQLTTAFTARDFHVLFESAKDCLCPDTGPLQLPAEFQEQIRSIDHKELSHVSMLDDFDRLLIFTDGSSQPNMKRKPPQLADELGFPDTWAFAVVGEQFTGLSAPRLTFFGWAAHPVRYEPSGDAFTGISHIGADQAERSALIGAGLWRLAHNHAIPTVFCCDAYTVGGQACGSLGTDCLDDSFRLLRGIFQALESALPHGHLRWHHTRAHAGELFNEIVDTAAKGEAQKSFNIRRQQLHLPTWHAKICQLWTAFGAKYGMPRWHDGSLDVVVPTLPCPTDAHESSPGPNQSKECKMQFCLSLATANVQSLYRGPSGHAGKLHYLQEQMRMFRLNCMAIQEARSERGMSCNGNILRLCSGHDHGHGGIEIWIDLDCPYAHDHRGRGSFFQKSHFQVVSANERCLLVRYEAGSWAFWLIALQAPHSGHSAANRHGWWNQIEAMLTEHMDGMPMFMMIDANCAPGEPDGLVVHQAGFATTPNTADFRRLLQKFELCLPATTEVHQGDHATWTSVSGLTSHCIDYVAIPQAWKGRCTHSETLKEFDLANVHEDHHAVALQMQWSASNFYQKKRPTAQQLRRSEDYVPDECVHLKILDSCKSSWHDDVEAHTQAMTAQLHTILDQHKTRRHDSAKKPYIDEEIWQLRQRKLSLKKKHKLIKKRLTFTAVAACFSAWKTGKLMECHDEELQYDQTLRCHAISSFVRLFTTCREMRSKLRTAKQRNLKEQLDQINTSTSASEVLQRLRKFVGPTNPKKVKKQQLPCIKDQDGRHCHRPEEALDAWVTFFQQMEGGKRMQHAQLRNQWISELHDFQQASFCGALDSLPSLTDLEAALRRIPKGKARGPDGIPGELCHHQPAAVARVLYAHLVKVSVHGQEPLEFKGGRLTAVYKGRGPADDCASYRSLLISNHLGKAIHRSLRMKYAPLYERFLQAQQTGGRRKIPVQLPLHQVRAFARHAREVGQSMAILCLDLQEAFYRIVREAPLGGEVSDEFMGFLAKKMNLPDDSLHQLYDLLEEPSALRQAGFNDQQRRCLQAIHTSTHFWMQGQTDVSRTTVGTRPGDCMADLVFGFAWACVLRKLEHYMGQIDAISAFADHDHLPLFGCFPPLPTERAFVGPTWMDDLAICTMASTPERLVSQIGCIAGQLLDICPFHCMQPNLSKGKTELMLTFRGAGSRKFRVRHYGPQAETQLPVIREGGISYIQLVSRYKHLGCTLHHTGDQDAEVQIKAAVGHTTFNQHRKILFGNGNIELKKRAELFQMIVLSKCLYGADTWVAMSEKTMKRFHVAIIRLYRRLLPKQDQQDHMEDETVLTKVALPSPLELLHRARLRYLATLVKADIADAWALLAKDSQWLGLVEQAMLWMWEQLRSSSSLPDPRQDFMQWLRLIQNSPGYWKRLVRRACEHSVLQRTKRHHVRQFHAEALRRLAVACPDLPAMSRDASPEPGNSGYFGCLQCQIKCRSRAGEAAHMCKAHSQISRLRSLFDSPTCPFCLKYFHTHSKMKAHLYYSERCRTGLESANMACDVGPGAGSQADARLEKVHDRVLPPLQAMGPRPQEPRRRDTIVYHEGFFDFIVQFVTENFQAANLNQAIRGFVAQQALSWTDFCGTIQHFVNHFEANDAEVFQIDLINLRDAFNKLIDPAHWPFLEDQEGHRKRPITMSEHEQRCVEIEEHIRQYGVAKCPRMVGRHRVLLHAYSGRRRVGDVQYFLEQFAALRPDYVIHVVSLDIIVDTQWGDASNPATREYWIEAIKAGYVLAFVGGPPCETWSRARGQPALESQKQGPRIIRDVDHLWGYDATTLREALQLIMGNTLLCFALWAILELALCDGFGILEHPAEPEDAPEKASIWRLPLVRTLLAMDHVQKIRFAQGLMGSFAPKPTHLLVVNMPELILDLHRNRVRRELPKAQAIGKDQSGHWKTTILKEYAPAFCKSMAEAFIRSFDSCKQTPAHEVPEAFLQQCKDMSCQDFGDYVGADFAHG